LRRLGLALLAVAFASEAWSADFIARRVLDDVRGHAGDAASLPECEGTLAQSCRVALGRSFSVRTEATSTGELIALYVAHNEMFADSAEQASDFMLAVILAVGGEDNAEAIAGLMDRALQSAEPLEEVIDGALYRVSADGDVFLEVRPER
jgi:hypothetical protein